MESRADKILEKAKMTLMMLYADSFAQLLEKEYHQEEEGAEYNHFRQDLDTLPAGYDRAELGVANRLCGTR